MFIDCIICLHYYVFTKERNRYYVTTVILKQFYKIFQLQLRIITHSMKIKSKRETDTKLSTTICTPPPPMKTKQNNNNKRLSISLNYGPFLLKAKCPIWPDACPSIFTADKELLHEKLNLLVALTRRKQNLYRNTKEINRA